MTFYFPKSYIELNNRGYKTKLNINLLKKPYKGQKDFFAKQNIYNL